MTEKPSRPRHVIGRYALYDEIAAGGMASVHFGRLMGSAGFSRTVAIKRLHPHYAKDPEFVSMFLDEAHLAARIQHPNVVPTLDVVATKGELFLVMDYIQGESFARLFRAAAMSKKPIPPRIVAAIMIGVLHGLHAAHEARGENREPLRIVHRDVSPANILVGADGIARVLDFGVAKAVGRIQTTHDGQIKGKLSYMAPEQLLNEEVTRKVDIYAAAVVLWEVLANQRLFHADSEGGVIAAILTRSIEPPSSINPAVPTAFDAIIAKAISRSPKDRYDTAREMSVALEQCGSTASVTEVSEWVESVAGDVLKSRAEAIAEIASTGPHSVRRVVSALDLSSIPPPAPETSSPERAADGLPPSSADTPPSRIETVSISIARELEAAVAPGRRVRRLVALAAIVIVVGGVAIAALTSKQRPASSTHAAAAPSHTSSAEPPPAPPPPTTSLVVASVTAPLPSSAPPIVASATPSASAPSARATATGPKRPAGPASSHPKVDSILGGRE